MTEPKFHRKQFTFYNSYFEAVEQLPKARQLEAYRLITDYALHGGLPEKISPQVGALFAALRPNIDSSRAKAQARLKELSDGAECDGDLPPTGNNKKKNKNEYKNKNKYKNKNEFEEEREEENENEGAQTRAEDAAAAASLLPAEKETEFTRLYAENPALQEPLERVLLHWEEQGAPLTALERRINALALGVQDEAGQLDSVRAMLQNGARLVTASS